MAESTGSMQAPNFTDRHRDSDCIFGILGPQEFLWFWLAGIGAYVNKHQVPGLGGTPGKGCDNYSNIKPFESKVHKNQSISISISISIF